MTPEQIKEFTEKFGKEAALEMKTLGEAIEKRLNDAAIEREKGFITEKEFSEVKDSIKANELTDLNKKMADLEEIAKEQGIIINTLKETGGRPVQKSLQEFFGGKIKAIEAGKEVEIDFMERVKQLRDAKTGFIDISGNMLKAAGVTSISNVLNQASIADQATSIGSPYLPGLGQELQLFDIARNPNFIITRVNLGRTNQFRLAWINEIDFLGTVDTAIAEGGAKPLTQHRFQVEFSTAKKAAAYIELTEEFDTDVPGLATAVRRMLGMDVMRAFDDQIQTDVIAAAHPFEITSLNGLIQDAAGWDAIMAMIGQVGSYNYTPDTVAMNYLTDVLLETSKDNNAAYLIPPFLDRFQSMLAFANKLAFRKALVGDLKQYNVDIYKDFTLRVGWINDDFIKNKFAVLGEIRYHSYISDARKKAICYDDIYETLTTIDGGSISGF